MIRTLTLSTLLAMAVGASASDWTAEVTPAQGTVTELGEISLRFPAFEKKDLEINSKNDIVLSYEGTPLAGIKPAAPGNGVITVAMPDGKPLTTPGKYVLSIAEAAICASNLTHTSSVDNPEALSYEWTIPTPADALDFDFTPSLSAEGYLGYFGELTLTFDKLDKVSYNGEGVTVGFNGNRLADVEVATAANKLTITLKDPLSSVEGTVNVDIAVEALNGEAGSKTGSNIKPIFLSYSMATPVEYNLTLTISSPKPNQDGQISGEKDLSSFFFVCEEKGLLAAPGKEANVTIKENDGDYEATGHLRKANGLNANYTYFSVDFSQIPAFNGMYTITIDCGAFGTQAWVEDPNYGRSNAEIQINFELVDGVSHDVYSIKPVKIEPEPGAYAKAKDIAIVTLTFPEGTEMAKGAMATLAGINSSYAATSRFTAVDGGFMAEFSPAPTDDGNYRLTVPGGSFGDAEFFATREGNASEPITIEYSISPLTGITVISPDYDGEIHDLQGRRVDPSTRPSGILIIDGKKVIVKN